MKKLIYVLFMSGVAFGSSTCGTVFKLADTFFSVDEEDEEECVTAHAIIVTNLKIGVTTNILSRRLC